MQYEFAQHGASETEEDRRRRRRRNQRRVSHEEGRLREVVGDLPPPPLAGSSQVEDNAYSAIQFAKSGRNDVWNARAQETR